jgi:hypothetical protein
VRNLGFQSLHDPQQASLRSVTIGWYFPIEEFDSNNAKVGESERITRIFAAVG